MPESLDNTDESNTQKSPVHDMCWFTANQIWDIMESQFPNISTPEKQLYVSTQLFRNRDTQWFERYWEDTEIDFTANIRHFLFFITNIYSEKCLKLLLSNKGIQQFTDWDRRLVNLALTACKVTQSKECLELLLNNKGIQQFNNWDLRLVNLALTTCEVTQSKEYLKYFNQLKNECIL